jgi:squalene-associated FAD-dependent desaturase
MASGTVHIVGAGIAGLAAAERLVQAGRGVVVYEAAQQAGGRCRSYFDETLNFRIDNGNHLLVSGNTAAMAYVSEIGAAATFVGSDYAAFPFVDLASNERWSVRPTEGRFPWWLFVKDRRTAGTGLLDYLDALRLQRAPAAATLSASVDTRSMIFRRLWAPLCVAALNTEPAAASAQLLGAIFAETFGRGGAGLHALFPREGLSESLVDPAIAKITQRGGRMLYGHRLREIGLTNDRAIRLDFGKTQVDLGNEDQVLLAVTAPVAADLLPGLVTPNEFRAIINAHFRADLPGEAHSFLGVIGGTAEWIFLKPGIISTTTSAADRLIDKPAEELARELWGDITRAYGLNAALPLAWRVVKEKRATFAATPAQLQRRPGAGTRWSNLALAGDWTDTGWPATIEGAIRSGFAAAAVLSK